MSKAQLKRGEKWSKILKENEFRSQTIPGHLKEVEWINKQKSIMDDIKAYEDSLKPVETKSKGKK